MANPQNGHGLFPGESWQAIYSNNDTGLQSDDIETNTIYGILNEEMESLRRTHGGVSHTAKTKWAAEEQLKLIVGVASSTSPKTGRKDWQSMIKNYFWDSKRGDNQLKQKWKKLQEHAKKKKDGSRKEFYMMVALVEAETPGKPEVKEEYANAINEWSRTQKQEDQVIMARAQQLLTMVKNMEPKQQLKTIREWVTKAEQCHAYGNIPYRECDKSRTMPRIW